MGNYIQPTDVSNWPDGATDASKAEVIELAEAMVERATKDVFYEQSFEVVLNGNGRTCLDLQMFPDVLTVTKVEILDGNGDVTTEVDSSDYTCDTQTISGYKWPDGINNIQVTGTRGHTACPAGVKRAATVLAEYENDPTLYDEVREGTVEEGGTRYSTKKRTLTGVLQADRLLRPFVRKKPKVGLV